MKPLLFAGVLFISSAGGALAADPAEKKPAPEPPPAAETGGFDYAVGAKFQTNYISRGITQTARGPGVTAYGELRYDWLYAGVQPWSVRLPSKPAAEIDLYTGIRPVFGPLSFDFGGIWYWYPDNKRQYIVGGFPTGAKDPSFGEIYGHAAYNWNDILSIGPNIFYSPNWQRSGATGTYVSGTAKISLPKSFQPEALQSVDLAVSGELGRYYLGTSNATLGFSKYKSYDYWNAGVSATYKAATLDLRFHRSSLDKANCFVDSSDPAGNVTGLSKWCGSAFVATLSFDITSATFK